MDTVNETLSDVVAQRVVLLRKRRNLTREQLAGRCEALGYAALTGPALANIETGRRLPDGRRRRDVTVDEIAALASALDVPPLLLMFPVGEGADPVPVIPGRSVPAWAGARWFSGDVYADDRLPLADQEAGSLIGNAKAWTSAAAPIHLFRAHDKLIGDYVDVMISKLFSAPEDDPERQKELAQATALVFRLRGLRGEMRRHGLTPPELDEELRHIDERRHVYLTPEQADAYAAAHPGDLKFADWAALRAAKDVKPGDGARIRAAQEFARDFERDYVADDAPDGGDDDS